MSHSERHRALVAEFERVAGAGPGGPTTIAEFCAAAGISRRTLQRACRAVHGVSPHRFQQSVRLTQARSMLSSTGVDVANVTEMAMRCGFLELGRFSILYRRAFGEPPSATLNRRAGGRDRVLNVWSRPCCEPRIVFGEAAGTPKKV